CQRNVQCIADQASERGDILPRLCLTPAFRQRVGGEVYGHNVSRPLYAAARLQGQQTRSRSQIDDLVTSPEPRSTQDTVTNSTERATRSLFLGSRLAAGSRADERV